MKNEEVLNMGYVIKVDGADFVCKGSYIVQGEKFKVIGDLKDARVFKSKESAEKELNKMYNRFANIDGGCSVVEVDDI